ncbi:hypothetical protein ACTA71_001588 [Dictyostelium dimigraforme]
MKLFLILMFLVLNQIYSIESATPTAVTSYISTTGQDSDLCGQTNITSCLTLSGAINSLSNQYGNATNSPCLSTFYFSPGVYTFEETINMDGFNSIIQPFYTNFSNGEKVYFNGNTITGATWFTSQFTKFLNLKLIDIHSSDCTVSNRYNATIFYALPKPYNLLSTISLVNCVFTCPVITVPLVFFSNGSNSYSFDNVLLKSNALTLSLEKFSFSSISNVNNVLNNSLFVIQSPFTLLFDSSTISNINTTSKNSNLFDISNAVLTLRNSYFNSIKSESPLIVSDNSKISIISTTIGANLGSNLMIYDSNMIELSNTFFEMTRFNIDVVMNTDQNYSSIFLNNSFGSILSSVLSSDDFIVSPSITCKTTYLLDVENSDVYIVSTFLDSCGSSSIYFSNSTAMMLDNSFGFSFGGQVVCNPNTNTSLSGDTDNYPNCVINEPTNNKLPKAYIASIIGLSILVAILLIALIVTLVRKRKQHNYHQIH